MVAASTLVGMLVAPRWGNSPVDLLYLAGGARRRRLLRPWPGRAGRGRLGARLQLFTSPSRSAPSASPAPRTWRPSLLLFLVALVTSQLAARMRAERARRQGQRVAQRDHRRPRPPPAVLFQRRADRRGRLPRAGPAVRLQCGADGRRARAASRRGAAKPRHADPERHRRRGLGDGVGRAGRARRRRRSAPPNGSSTRSARIPPFSAPSAWPATTARARCRPASSTCSTIWSTRSRWRSSAAGWRPRRASSPRAAGARPDSARPCCRRSARTSSPGCRRLPAASTGCGAAGRATRRLLSAIGSEVAKLQRYLSNLLDLGPEADQRPVAGGRRDDRPVPPRRVPKRRGGPSDAEGICGARRARETSRPRAHPRASAAHRLGTGAGKPDRISARRGARRCGRSWRTIRRGPRLILNEPGVGYRLMAGE